MNEYARNRRMVSGKCIGPRSVDRTRSDREARGSLNDAVCTYEQIGGCATRLHCYRVWRYVTMTPREAVLKSQRLLA